MSDHWRHLQFEPLYLKIASEPNLATPHAFFSHSSVILQYWADIPSAGLAAQVRFLNCSKYRIGDPNDEGFYSDGVSMRNSSIYNTENFPNLDFNHGFYEVLGSSVDAADKLHSGFVSNPDLSSTSGLNSRHFLFLMRDATFECFAESFDEGEPVSVASLDEQHAEHT